MSAARLVRATVVSFGIVGLGYALMVKTTPTDEEFYKSLSPELKRQVDQRRAEADRRAAYAEQVTKAKESADAEEPAWAAQKVQTSTPPRL